MEWRLPEALSNQTSIYALEPRLGTKVEALPDHTPEAKLSTDRAPGDRN
jgi:hypothetical protein